MRLRCRFATHDFTVTLNDSPTSRDLLSLLPLDLTLEDYANNEKMAYLPRKLTEQAAAPYSDPAVGDVCTYAPWGNLVFFYAAYLYAPGLIRLGRINGPVTPLLTRGRHALTVTAQP